jgi:hypothetical protein
MTRKFAKTSMPVKHLPETAILEVRSRKNTNAGRILLENNNWSEITAHHQGRLDLDN